MAPPSTPVFSLPSGGAHRARSLIERGAKSASELCGVIIRPEMKEEETRLFVQHVAVNGRDLNAI